MVAGVVPSSIPEDSITSTHERNGGSIRYARKENILDASRTRQSLAVTRLPGIMAVWLLVLGAIATFAAVAALIFVTVPQARERVLRPKLELEASVAAYQGSGSDIKTARLTVSLTNGGRVPARSWRLELRERERSRLRMFYPGNPPPGQDIALIGAGPLRAARARAVDSTDVIPSRQERDCGPYKANIPDEGALILDYTIDAVRLKRPREGSLQVTSSGDVTVS
jgi:hypothetical protein